MDRKPRENKKLKEPQKIKVKLNKNKKVQSRK